MPQICPILASWNRLDPGTAAAALLPCNGSHAWAAGVASRAPFDTPAQLFAASDEVWSTLAEPDRQEAFASHPRIGERHAPAATPQSEVWSAGEQAGAAPDAATSAALAQGNRDYEAKFGRIFLVCATGKSAAEIFTLLQHRLFNDPEAELREAAEQQRQITQLRLRKWLAMPAEAC